MAAGEQDARERVERAIGVAREDACASETGRGTSKGEVAIAEALLYLADQLALSQRVERLERVTREFLELAARPEERIVVDGARHLALQEIQAEHGGSR
jgi:hypothetical protein